MEGIGERRLNIDALRQRLRQVGGPARLSAGEARLPPVAPARGGDALAAVLGGEAHEAGCHVIAARYEGTHRHAGVPLDALWHCDGGALATLGKDRSLACFDFRRTLFLDTETNGLAGGAGTYAFLVGVAYWEGDHFEVRQFFMRHPQEERALLAALQPLLDRFESFVTFNGKSFDLPVLETRFILARQPRALKERPHLDLLHPARRLWRLRLESCSLGTLERRILGTMRDESDVPGYLIPHLYNTFLRDGDARPLRGVVYHNHQDLLALAALAVQMTRICGDPEQHAAPHGQDLFSLARLYEDSREWTRAEWCYRHALLAPIPLGLRRDCLCRLSLMLKRLGRWDDATTLWRSVIGQGELYPYIELAKYHEHQSRDLASAERAVLAAFGADRDGALHLSPGDRADLRHRLTRLRRRLAPRGEV